MRMVRDAVESITAALIAWELSVARLNVDPVPNAPTPGWIRRLARAAMRHRGVAVTALMASGLGVSLDAVGPLLTRSAVDQAAAGSTAALVPIVVAILALALVRFGAAFLRRFMGGRLALDVQHDLRR